MMSFSRAAVVALLLAASLALVAHAEEFVNTVSIFEIGGSVRAIGMGGTFIAVADDDAAVFYNPAGLAQLERSMFSSLFTRPFGEYSYGRLSAAQTGWGAQFLLLDSHTLVERDEFGNPVGEFRHTETGFVLSVGVQVGAGFSVGIQGKLHAVVLPSQGMGLSLSPALMFEEGERTYALVWRNSLSTDLQFAGGSTEPWTPDLAAGVSWRTDAEIYAVDFTERLVTRGDTSSDRVGIETIRFHPLVLRIGTHREGSSFGASLEWQDLRLDFAYVLHYALPDSYYVSVSYIWDDPLLRTMGRPFRWILRLLGT